MKLKEQAEEYASLIMEELDPENFGYIQVNYISHILAHKLWYKVRHAANKIGPHFGSI